MPMLNNVAKMVLKPVPRMLSPRVHSIVDLFVVGSFLAGSALFWKRNKRASIAALLCGGAELAVSLLTDYPNGFTSVISFRAHRDIDLGLAAMTATMPEFLAFKDEAEKNFFLAQGMLITGITELTQFPEKPQRAEKGRNSKAA